MEHAGAVHPRQEPLGRVPVLRHDHVRVPGPVPDNNKNKLDLESIGTSLGID